MKFKCFIAYYTILYILTIQNRVVKLSLCLFFSRKTLQELKLKNKNVLLSFNNDSKFYLKYNFIILNIVSTL